MSDDVSGRPRDQRRFAWFWEAVSPYWRVYRDVLIASFLVNLFALVSPLFVMNVYDRVVPNQAFETLWMLAVGVVLAYTFEFVLRLLRTRYIDLAGRQIDLTLSSRLMDRLLGLKMAARPGNSGTLMSSLAEFESIRSFITSTSVMAFIDLPFVVLFLGLVIWLGGWLVLIPLFCIGLSLVIAWGLNRPLQRVISHQQELSSRRQNFLMELLLGLVAVKACNVERQNQERWSEINREAADASLTIRKLQTLSTQSATFLLQLNTVALVIGGVYLISTGDLSMGGLIATMMIAGRCSAPVSQVIGLLNQYDKAVQAMEYAGGIMNLPQESPQDRQLLTPGEFKGHWTVNNVAFAYPDSPALIQQLNLTIHAGEKLAVLGHMGSGKTTFLNLLMGLYEPSEGHISLNNIDARQLDPSWVREHIGYVPQKAELFNTSLRDNITMGRSGINDSDVIEALDKAGLGGIVQAGSAGLDYLVGEGGRYLSGGQVQAVGLARALVTKPQALIMDEPTSAMDSQAEARFRKLLAELEGVTVILVTHKVTLLDQVDTIAVFDQGVMRAHGRASEMLARQSAASTAGATHV